MDPAHSIICTERRQGGPVSLVFALKSNLLWMSVENIMKEIIHVASAFYIIPK